MNIVQPIRNREDIEKMKAVLKRKKRDLVLFIFGINYFKIIFNSD